MATVLAAGCGALGDDRPIEHRIEGEFVLRRIDADGIARRKGGAQRQRLGKRLEPQTRHVVDAGVAGNDIGEARRQRGFLVALRNGRLWRGLGAQAIHRRRYAKHKERARRDAERTQPQLAGERQRDQRVGDEGGKRRGEQRSAQIHRRAGAQRTAREVRRREIESGDLVVRAQCLHRDESVARAVEPRRMLGARRAREIRGDRLRGRPRRAERAESVENAQRRETRPDRCRSRRFHHRRRGGSTLPPSR